jgi:hypothetical protein
VPFDLLLSCFEAGYLAQREARGEEAPVVFMMGDVPVRDNPVDMLCFTLMPIIQDWCSRNGGRASELLFPLTCRTGALLDAWYRWPELHSWSAPAGVDLVVIHPDVFSLAATLGLVVEEGCWRFKKDQFLGLLGKPPYPPETGGEEKAP